MAPRKSKGKGKGKEKATASTSTSTSTSVGAGTSSSSVQASSPAAGGNSGAAMPQASTPRATTPGPSKPGTRDAGVQVGTVQYGQYETSPEQTPYVAATTGGYAGNKNAFYQQGVKPGYRSIGTQTADTYVDPQANTGNTFHTEQYIDPGGVKRWENEDRVFEWPEKRYNPDGTIRY